MFNDRLLKALSPRKDALIIAINATQTVDESMRRTKAFPPSMVHLGRGMMAAALLQALTDADEAETVSLQWTAKGPFGGLFSEARGQGQLRGAIDYPQVEIEDLSTRLGPGILQVRRAHPNPNISLGSTGHISSVGEESEDLVEYLEKSEQRQCGLQLHVKIKFDESRDPAFPFRVERAIGYLIHVLPANTPQESQSLVAHWDEVMKVMGPLSSWHWDETLDPALQTLQFLVANSSPDIRVDSQIKFHCTCSEERASRALALATRLDPDPQDALSKSNKAILKCEFCGLVYEIPLLQGPPS